ncbi:secreted frizzled-related protein 3-like [Diadema antillarum]|uniref:secreted frizzled-related protein 3-like n=1 Tax=Diadema antillarum TaxID=105358 RepID=UPI003A87538B
MTLLVPVRNMVVENRPECQPVELPMCHGMPYNLTRMPNLLHHSTQENAKLAIEQFLPLVETNCNTNLTFFLCAIYAPICTVGFMEDPVPPCKSLCESVRADCEPIIVPYNISWPIYLSCDQFPEYTSGVCITREAIVDSGPTTELMVPTPQVPLIPPDNCELCPYNFEISKNVFFEKEYEYIIHAVVQGFSHGSRRGEIAVTVIIQHVIKSSDIQIPTGEVQLSINHVCACPKLSVGEEYMIMCYQDLIHGRLLLENDCLAQPWHNKYTKRVKKWDKKLVRDQRERDSSDLPSSRRNRDVGFYDLYG